MNEVISDLTIFTSLLTWKFVHLFIASWQQCRRLPPSHHMWQKWEEMILWYY